MTKLSEITCINNLSYEYNEKTNVLIFDSIDFDKTFDITIGQLFTDKHFDIEKTSVIRNRYSQDQPNYRFSINTLIKNANGFLSSVYIKKIIFINCIIGNNIFGSSSTDISFVFKYCDFGLNLSDFIEKLQVIQNENQIKKIIKLENCDFKEFSIENFDNSLNFILIGGKIELLKISHSEINSKFYINKQYDGNSETTKIDRLEIKNTKFVENFKLHNCILKKSYISDVDFEKNADFFKTIFIEGIYDKEVYFKAINFQKLALFGNTEFKNKVIFKYITFDSFVHFREAIFNNGLDLDYVNIQNEINFYRIKIINSSTVTQETFRIIKHHLEKIGNKIEANRYHALELNKNRKNIWSSKRVTFDLFQRGLVSFVHFISSNHSQSWILPLIWIFITSYIVSLSIKGYYDLQYLSILADIKLNQEPMLFILHKSILGYLYYQFLVTVRKDTKQL